MKSPPNDGVYMHPQILTHGLKLPLTKFICSVLTYYWIAPFVTLLEVIDRECAEKLELKH